MKKRVLFTFTLLLCLFINNCSKTESDKISTDDVIQNQMQNSLKDGEVLFATGEWEPYVSEKMPNYGYAAELVSAICEAGGIKPVFKFYPWNRAEKMVEDGSVFAAFPYAISEDRKVKFDFSEPIFYNSPKFIYYIKNKKTEQEIPFKELSDLKNYKIGYLSGSWYEEKLAAAGLTLEKPSKIEQVVMMLQAGRIDFMVDDYTAAYYAISKVYPNDLNDYKDLANPFAPASPSALMVSKSYTGSKEILDKFHKGLEITKQNGTYYKITSKYKLITK